MLSQLSGVFLQDRERLGAEFLAPFLVEPTGAQAFTELVVSAGVPETRPFDSQIAVCTRGILFHAISARSFNAASLKPLATTWRTGSGRPFQVAALHTHH